MSFLLVLLLAGMEMCLLGFEQLFWMVRREPYTKESGMIKEK